MKKILLTLPVMFLLAACATKSLDDRISQGEAVVGQLTQTVSDLYEPCVDGDTTNEDKCLITQENAELAYQAAKTADTAFDRAHESVVNGTPASAEEWLRAALKQLVVIEDIINLIKGN